MKQFNQNSKAWMKTDLLLRTEWAWSFARKNLWGNFPISEREIRKIKTFIQEHFEEIIPEIYFQKVEEKSLEFAIRILLVRAYLARQQGRFVTHPVLWFNPNNSFGFSGTKSWFERHMEEQEFRKYRFGFENGNSVVHIQASFN